MKQPQSILARVLVLAVVSFVGCDRHSSPGGPGATDPGHKPLVGQADDTFSLTTSSVTLHQGGTTQETIGIKRGANFDQDVTLAFEGTPSGVTLNPTHPVIGRGNADAKFTLTANDGAALGDFTVKVIGHPAKGSDAANQFTLTMAKKPSFTLSMPFWTPSLKQGEAKAFTIAISREKAFDQDVTLRFEGLPMGVTVEPANVAIKNGESDAKLILKATPTAAVGDFDAKVTGHPARGADVAHEFKFSVSKNP